MMIHTFERYSDHGDKSIIDQFALNIGIRNDYSPLISQFHDGSIIM